MKLRCWGESANMSDREKKRFIQSVRLNAGLPANEPIELVPVSDADMKEAAAREVRSKRGGVEGG